MRLDEREIEILNKMGWEVEDRGSDGRPPQFRDCNWWRLTYKHLEHSIYYDPSDILGVVGKPYFEYYDGDDTYRYLEYSKDEFIRFCKDLNRNQIQHEQDFIDFPERFL